MSKQKVEMLRGSYKYPQEAQKSIEQDPIWNSSINVAWGKQVERNS